MRFTWKRDASLGVLEISDAPSPHRDAVQMLREALSDASLKGVVIILASTAAAERRDTGSRRELLLDDLTEILSFATVPLAVVSPETPPALSDGINALGHFRFGDVNAALGHLRTLTDTRPSHVISAVMTAFNAQKYLSLEAALLEESRLFAALARVKQTGETEPV